MATFYVTTAIDYVNDVIHIGHAYQKILADALARYHRQIGEKTFFLTGTDEHGNKTQQAAAARGIPPQTIADQISAQDKQQLNTLNLSYDRFIRTTDEDHIQQAQDFYQKIYARGDIYPGTYTGIYCIGCEDFLTAKDLVNGKCPEHPKETPRQLSEKNYFFRWSKYSNFLRDLLENSATFLIPQARRAEMLAFLEQGLQDIPFTRPKKRVQFAIEVPNDPTQTLYVWVEALVNYITGFPEAWQTSSTRIVHILGKNNVRFHALMWPAMLKSAGYRLPNTIYGHDFFTINGTKISKSLGNVIRPSELVEHFGTDAVRYFFLRYGPLRDDVDVTMEKIRKVYNADLANGLGNLVSRVATLARRVEAGNLLSPPTLKQLNEYSLLHQRMQDFRVDLALELIWQKISALDKYIDYHRVWEQENEELEQSLTYLVQEVHAVGVLLEPFIPTTAQKIREQFQKPRAVRVGQLFPRIS